MSDRIPRTLYDGEHELFRETVRAFLAAEVTPHVDRWERDGIVDRSLYRVAGAAGLLLFPTPEQFGGAAVDDWRYSAIVSEEFSRAGHSSAGLGLALHNDVVAPYLLDLTDDGQKARWLPGATSGELVGAIAMTEPGAGSDLAGITTAAVRDGDHYVVDGAKTFISSGQNADLVVLVTRTSPDRHRGLTLLVVERDTPGFHRGRNLDKLGLHGQDTSELHFTGARVPVANRLGAEGEGFLQLVHNLPQERLSLAAIAVSAVEGILARTLSYVRDRQAFGKPIGSFQHNRFLLAELTTEVDIARVFVDRCLQLHGGYGYMREYPIARDFVDARVQTIYGGTTEIMKEIVGRDLGL